MLEKALVNELNNVSEIKDLIFPTNAPEGQKSPYLVYIKTYYNQLKTLDGFTNTIESSYLLNILASKYSEMVLLRDKIKSTILTFPLRVVGLENIYVEDVTINNITEAYESELALYRGIIDVKISYKEE